MDNGGFLNIDAPEHPGKWADIFEALGRACMEFQQKEK